MLKSVFLSHNHQDKEFVRKLANDIESHCIKVWLDEAEIKIGDSLIQKIRDGIDNVDYFAVILSNNSVNAPWVTNELDIAMNYQIENRIKILPIVLEKVELPSFLIGKLYADFSNSDNYQNALKLLIESMGTVFNKKIFSKDTSSTLFTALDAAKGYGFPIMCAPYHRPYQYLGMQMKEVENIVKTSRHKQGNNIRIENNECRMVIWGEGNFVNFVEVDMKKTAPHYVNQEFDSEPLLGALSIGLNELELFHKQTHCHTYLDHKKKIKVKVSCLYDGAPLTVSFGTKYFGTL